MDEIEKLEGKATESHESGDYQAGLEACKQLIALKPEDPTYLIWGATNLDGLGRSTEAIDFCERAVAIDPREYLALVQMGISLAKLGEIQKAIGAYSQSIEISPSSFAFSLRATCFVRRAVEQLYVCVEFLKRLDIDAKTEHEKLAVEELRRAVADFRRAEDLSGEASEMIDVLLATIRNAETRGLQVAELKQAAASLVGCASS